MNKSQFFLVGNNTPLNWKNNGTFPEQWEHFNLRLPIYTKFTSPIRSYPDLLVHRLLSTCIGSKKEVQNEFDYNELVNITNDINSKIGNQKKLTRQLSKIFHLLYLKRLQDQGTQVIIKAIIVGCCQRLRDKEKFIRVFIPDLNEEKVLELGDQFTILR